MSLVASITKLNNDGVLQFELGNFQEALGKFTAALKNSIGGSESGRVKNSNESGFDSSNQWSRKPCTYRCSPGDSSSGFIIHARTLLMDEATQYSTLLIGAVTFNFALTSHLRSIELGPEKGHNLMKSTLKVYTQAKALLNGTPYVMYVLENMIHIIQELVNQGLREKEDVVSCKDELEKNIQCFGSYRTRFNTSSSNLLDLATNL